eukprot:SAG31_NODE_201_length_20535_cov_15.315081_11_plen_50_part_00
MSMIVPDAWARTRAGVAAGVVVGLVPAPGLTAVRLRAPNSLLLLQLKHA